MVSRYALHLPQSHGFVSIPISRLLTATRGWRNPNSVLLNGIMAVLLILFYASASLIVSYSTVLITDDDGHIAGVPSFPLQGNLSSCWVLTLLLLQMVIMDSGCQNIDVEFLTL